MSLVCLCSSLFLLPGRELTEQWDKRKSVFSFTGIETEQKKMKRTGSWHYLTPDIMLCNLSMKKAWSLARDVSPFVSPGWEKKMAAVPLEKAFSVTEHYEAIEVEYHKKKSSLCVSWLSPDRKLIHKHFNSRLNCVCIVLHLFYTIDREGRCLIDLCADIWTMKVCVGSLVTVLCFLTLS